MKIEHRGLEEVETDDRTRGKGEADHRIEKRKKQHGGTSPEPQEMAGPIQEQAHKGGKNLLEEWERDGGNVIDKSSEDREVFTESGRSLTETFEEACA